MTTDTLVREDFRHRRVHGGLLVFIALPLTLFWARFGFPLRYDWKDLLFFASGPGMLLCALWAAFPTRAPAVRLRIKDDELVLHQRGPRAGDYTIALVDLVRIQRPSKLIKQDRLIFATKDGEVTMDVVQLTHTATEILNLVSIRLENQSKHLFETTSPVLGAGTGIWEVREGNPFVPKSERDKLGHDRE